MSQLPADCLNEIFDYLEEDKFTLHSCLLVNRLWCGVSVRILWKNVWNYKTLITCLPKESKEILYENKIITTTLNSKTPLFDYTTFIKSLSIYNVHDMIKNILQNYQSITPQNLNYKKYIVAREIYKFLMNKISSLRELYFYSYPIINVPNVTFTSYPGAKDCLKYLSKLSCRSDIYPEFFYQLSKICENLQSLSITFENIISNGLIDLISVQKNLKHLVINKHLELSFITKFTNLQELILSFDYNFEYFKELQYASFPHLQVLKFNYSCPKYELLIKFLENNGKNLKEFYVKNNGYLLNLAIAKFCPNLRKLFTIFRNDELETIKVIFNNCQYLESIQAWCGGRYLNDKEILDIIVKYSPRNFYELNIYYIWGAQPKILPEELEEFFINWNNRIPQKSFSFIITKGSKCLKFMKENIEVIEKYKKLGIIKKFKL
ncbi:hypothetical protein RhiirB3_522596 [Rhizophagus irregularis]|nr:hypothetical protein RhiirB3_522596 [Rhizophagus irregularis]